MTESEIQRDIIAYLKTAGFMVYRMNSGAVRHNVKMCDPGTPDILVISPYAKTTWIEVKTEYGKLSLVQQNMHSRLRSYGQEVIVARSVEDVKGIV